MSAPAETVSLEQARNPDYVRGVLSATPRLISGDSEPVTDFWRFVVNALCNEVERLAARVPGTSGQ